VSEDGVIRQVDMLADAIERSSACDDELEGSMLKKWVLVAEWNAPDGGAFLSYIDADAVRESLMPWDAMGMLLRASQNVDEYKNTHFRNDDDDD
jgi:hypothetical protein